LTPNCKKAKSSSASSSSSSSPVALEVDSARPATHWEALEPILKLNKIPRDAPLPRYKRPLNDPALCDSVADLIFEQCYDQQEKYSAKPYMTIQSDLNYKMRGILVDWIIDVHLSMKLLPPTLWLTVNIMDRYLSKTPIMRKVLQLVGIAALSLACKTEEIYAPGPQDFVYITDNAYSTTELMGMELNVLEVLGWQLAVPTSYHFLLRYLDAVHATTETRLLAHFYAERNLQESDVLQHRPNIYAASAVYAALTQRLSIGAPTSSDITIDERQKTPHPETPQAPVEASNSFVPDILFSGSESGEGVSEEGGEAEEGGEESLIVDPAAARSTSSAKCALQGGFEPLQALAQAGYVQLIKILRFEVLLQGCRPSPLSASQLAARAEGVDREVEVNGGLVGVPGQITLWGLPVTLPLQSEGSERVLATAALDGTVIHQVLQMLPGDFTPFSVEQQAQLRREVADLYMALRIQEKSGRPTTTSVEVSHAELAKSVLKLQVETQVESYSLSKMACTMIDRVSEMPISNAQRLLNATNRKYSKPRFLSVAKWALPYGVMKHPTPSPNKAVASAALAKSAQAIKAPEACPSSSSSGSSSSGSSSSASAGPTPEPDSLASASNVSESAEVSSAYGGSAVSSSAGSSRRLRSRNAPISAPPKGRKRTHD